MELNNSCTENRKSQSIRVLVYYEITVSPLCIIRCDFGGLVKYKLLYPHFPLLKPITDIVAVSVTHL